MGSQNTTEPSPTSAQGKRHDWLPAAGQLIAGKYELGEVLQRGGMGVVVAARHVALAKDVAIKFLPPRGDAASSGRFLREARTAAKLSSEHVARVIDVGTTSDGLLMIVMERLTGHDSADLLDEREELPVAEAVDLDPAGLRGSRRGAQPWHRAS